MKFREYCVVGFFVTSNASVALIGLSVAWGHCIGFISGVAAMMVLNVLDTHEEEKEKAQQREHFRQRISRR